jgi:CHAT domain-containing protein
LPGAAIEAKSVARFFAKSEVLSGAAATADQFLTKESAFDAVHFAGHAIWNERSPRHAALRFARDSRHPMGDLHADELREHPIGRTRLAVLAACDTARGRVTGAGPLSFARAYSAIGVPQVIGSLWPVDDAASEAFFSHFYEALTRGESPAEALNAAQRREIESNESGPASWATFQLYSGTSGFGGKGTS